MFQFQTSYILSKCRTATCSQHLLQHIRLYLTLAAETVALALAILHLDYANSLYSGLPSVEVWKLQRIQTMTAKVLIQRRKYSSSTEALIKNYNSL